MLKALKKLPVDTINTTRKNIIGIPKKVLDAKQKNSELI